MSVSIDLPDPAATDRLGSAIAVALAESPSGIVVALKGELGAGKSTLARAILRAMGHSGAVPSPTYTLVEPYRFADFDVYHVDLYRIADPEELEFLGWSDLAEGLCLVEWPERVPGIEARADLVVMLEYAEAGRRAGIEAGSPDGLKILSRTGLK